MSESARGLDFFAGFLIGALAGAAAALLLTPQSGEETRALLRDKSIELKDQATALSAEARKRAEAVEARAKERAADLQSQVKRAVEEGKTAAIKRKEELLSRVEHSASELEAPAQ